MMKLLLLIVIAIGVTLIYDARKITTNFSNQDKNKTVMLLKLVGFLFCAISGTVMVFLNV